VIVVCGEALIDRIPSSGTDSPGGGPFTTARALARLGIPTQFLGRLSTDRLGQQLRDLLRTDGADLSLTSFGPEPTTLAIAEVDPDGHAAYRFVIDGTSAPNLTRQMLPDSLSPDVSVVHVGTLGLVFEPVATTIADAKFYSFYMSGFYDATAKTVEGFVVEDPFVEPTDFTVATVRFVHAISNANPMTLYAKNTTTGTEVAVGVEIAYKGAGTFTALPAGAYDLSTRYTGLSTNALARPGVSFLGGRVYTITARGDITAASSATCGSTNKTCLDNTANR